MTRRVVTATVVVALLGSVLVGANTLVLLVAAVSFGLVHHEWRRSARADAGSGAGSTSAATTAPPRAAGPTGIPLAGWSDAELCRAWRVTYSQLQQHRGATWVEQLAEQRRAFLDELQRRDPDGVAAWIASGARAAGDPARYLRRAAPGSARPTP